MSDKKRVADLIRGTHGGRWSSSTQPLCIISPTPSCCYPLSYTAMNYSPMLRFQTLFKKKGDVLNNTKS